MMNMDDDDDDDDSSTRSSTKQFITRIGTSTGTAHRLARLICRSVLIKLIRAAVLLSTGRQFNTLWFDVQIEIYERTSFREHGKCNVISQAAIIIGCLYGSSQRAAPHPGGSRPLYYSCTKCQGRRKQFGSGGGMASAGARAYNGGLGAEPPAGSRGRAPGQGSGGRSPPEAESFLTFGRLTKAAEFAVLTISCEVRICDVSTKLNRLPCNPP